jgi:hypothetical protein
MNRSRRRLAILPAAMILAAAAVVAAPMLTLAASGGDSNRGDVWLDNVGQPAGPGHEMDPHLACVDINLWGANMGDSAGVFTIDGWPPSGHQEQVYPGSGSASWRYGGGKQPQVIAVIPVHTLVANAAARCDTPAHQGYHFKLQLSQDPQKHKTFWVNCPAPAGTGGGTGGGGGGGTGGGGGGTTGGSGGTGGTGGTQVSGETTGAAGASTASTPPVGLAQTGESPMPQLAFLLLGLIILLGGLATFRGSLARR